MHTKPMGSVEGGVARRRRRVGGRGRAGCFHAEGLRARRAYWSAGRLSSPSWGLGCGWELGRRSTGQGVRDPASLAPDPPVLLPRPETPRLPGLIPPGGGGMPTRRPWPGLLSPAPDASRGFPMRPDGLATSPPCRRGPSPSSNGPPSGARSREWRGGVTGGAAVPSIVMLVSQPSRARARRSGARRQGRRAKQQRRPAFSIRRRPSVAQPAHPLSGRVCLASHRGQCEMPSRRQTRGDRDGAIRRGRGRPF